MNEEDAILDFYVATRFSNRQNAKRVINALTNFEAGNVMCVSHDWTGETMDDYENRKNEICMADFYGALSCDVFIMLLPANAGSYTELGIALAADAQVILWGEKHEDFLTPAGYENVFYSHPNVQRRICPFEDFISEITRDGLLAFNI
jgi:hypothetical protein